MKMKYKTPYNCSIHPDQDIRDCACSMETIISRASEETTYINIAINVQEIRSLVKWLEWLKIYPQDQIELSKKGNQLADPISKSILELEDIEKLLRIFKPLTCNKI